MKNIMAALLALLILPALSVAEPMAGRKVSSEGFNFVLPPQWNMPKDKQPTGRKKAKEKIVVITKDGFQLNVVEFRKRLLTTEFGYTKKLLAAGMMPQEMAEVVLSDFELNQSMKNLKIIENKPATIAGIPGIRLVYSYRSNGMLQYQDVLYGFQKDGKFYSILYSAPKRHYYDTNLQTFESLVKTMTLDQEGSGQGNSGGEI
jgi:hypothetical protein